MMDSRGTRPVTSPGPSRSTRRQVPHFTDFLHQLCYWADIFQAPLSELPSAPTEYWSWISRKFSYAEH